MVTKRKPARRRTTGRKAKKDRSWIKKLGFGFALIVFLAASVIGAWWARDHFMPGSVNEASVEGVLIAAGVDLDKQREVVEKDGVERWKIDLKSAKTKEQIMTGLRMVVEARGGKWVEGEEIQRKNDLIHLVDLAGDGSETLRLIFIVDQSKRSSKRPTNTARKTKKSATTPKPRVIPENTTAELKPADPPPPLTAHTDQPTIAIILDDIGQRDPSILDPVLDLKYPITFAVLPFLPYTKQNAHHLHRNRYEVILHMPMEPDGSKSNPGKGAIFTHFSLEQARNAVDRAMDDVPFIKGVNNHMGSKATANRAIMTPVLEQVKKRELYFVDSRTKSNTVAYTVARQLGLKTAKRDVFLDSQMTYDFAVKQIREAKKVADKNGIAIAIGHPYPTTLQALVDELPKLDQDGYRFVFASTVIEALHGNL